VLYAHYDGQPVARARWASEPWTPTLRDAPLDQGGRVVPLPARGEAGAEWRLYARSASDDKGPIVAMLAALDALRAAGARPSVNLKFFFEGEEEAGSPHLRAVLQRHQALLRADAWIFADGPVHPSRRAVVAFGVRGVTGLELTLYGPARALHSGHYGNWAPNPAAQLAGLLATMRDAEGRILIPGFMDDIRPPTAADRQAIAATPRPDSALRAALQIGRVEGDGAELAERILLPALNVRGLSAGAVGGGAANAIPTEARASIDFRLVPDQRPERIRQLVEAHLARLGYHVVAGVPDAATRQAHRSVVRLEWDMGYPALRTPLDAPVSRALVRVVRDATGTAPYEVPSQGGSLPLHHFGDVLGAPVLILPIVNHDNNQHADNENLRIANLREGIDVFAAVIARLGAAWP
jgi:acetylornithine deacetylase/succinyl-diaminopimelate desuccinylase-like protein